MLATLPTWNTAERRRLQSLCCQRWAAFDNEIVQLPATGNDIDRTGHSAGKSMN
jgi:hypothetical protein